MFCCSKLPLKMKSLLSSYNVVMQTLFQVCYYERHSIYFFSYRDIVLTCLVERLVLTSASKTLPQCLSQLHKTSKDSTHRRKYSQCCPSTKLNFPFPFDSSLITVFANEATLVWSCSVVCLRDEIKNQADVFVTITLTVLRKVKAMCPVEWYRIISSLFYSRYFLDCLIVKI